MKTLAILDDYQDAVRHLPFWKRLDGRVSIDVFRDTLAGEDALVERLKPYAIVVASASARGSRPPCSRGCRRSSTWRSRDGTPATSTWPRRRSTGSS